MIVLFFNPSAADQSHNATSPPQNWLQREASALFSLPPSHLRHFHINLGPILHLWERTRKYAIGYNGWIG